jgi:Zn-finger nucleic acid-binding protein
MPHHPVACAICGNTMQKQLIPQGVEIDVCDTHGVWLDRGELESLVQREALPAGAGARKRGAPAPEGGFGATMERAGQQFGQSMVRGAGSTLGRRLMNGVVDKVFGRR